MYDKLLNVIPLIFSTLLISGCTFTPLYNKVPSDEHLAGSQNNHVKFSVTGTSKDVESYLVYSLQKELDKRISSINSVATKPVTIYVAISDQHGGIGYNPDAQASRYLSRLHARITLSHDEKAIMDLDAVTSYNVDSAQEFVIQNTQQSTRDRLVIELANKIQQAAVYLLTQKK